MVEFLGDGIFNVDGESWKNQRQVASHLFKVKEMRHMVEVFSNHSKSALQILDTDAEPGKRSDNQDLYSRVTLDCIGEIGTLRAFITFH